MLLNVAAATGILVAVVTLNGCATLPPPSVVGPQARNCKVENDRFVAQQTLLTPTMTVSNDGWCKGQFRRDQFGPISIETDMLPQHGALVTDDSNSSVASYYYIPTKSYVGPDAYAVRILGGRLLVKMAVNVTP